MSDEPGDQAAAYARPHGVEGAFAPHVPPPPYTPPPPTVSPQESAVFGRPAGSGAFDPAPGERIAPRSTYHSPVPRIFADAYAAPPAATPDGFDPAPGTRLPPTGAQPEPPWWKADAARDPWRDPASPFWLGSGAVFTRGEAAQLDAADDTDAGDAVPDTVADTDADDAAGTVRHVRFGPRTVTLAVVLTLLAGLIGGTAGWFLTDHVHDALHRPDVSIAQVDTATNRPAGSVAGIAKRVGPAVVSIAVRTSTQFGIGSGVVIDTQGDVLTNNHVVSGAAGGGASIVVTFSNESTARAQIVGTDATSDLAVIKVPNDQLTVASLGRSAKLAVGDPVIAIGSPLGLQGTVTAGIVSALNRPVHVFSDDGSSDAYLDAIQTDAPINPGNSGGALVDGSGAVIGINSAAALGSTGRSGTQVATSGIGYAIPIDYAHTIALELIHTGKAVHASIGAQGITTLSGTQVGGYLKQVVPGGPAAKAGLKPGDVVVVADNKVVQTFDQVIVIVQEHKPGDRIGITYYRGTQKRTATVTLGAG